MSARWFMLSDSPPDRDVEWTQAGVEGAGRFVQRIWALYAGLPEAAKTAAPDSDDTSLSLRRVSHKSVAAIDRAVSDFRFNSAVASIHEWVGAIREAGKAKTRPLGAEREALSMLARCLVLFMPHLAEACWEQIGETGFVSTARWPEIDPALLKDDTITLPIQVNGKKRGEIKVSPEISKVDAERLALENPQVSGFIADKAVKKVIVVPGRIVNIVI